MFCNQVNGVQYFAIFVFLPGVQEGLLLQALFDNMQNIGFQLGPKVFYVWTRVPESLRDYYRICIDYW